MLAHSKENTSANKDNSEDLIVHDSDVMDSYIMKQVLAGNALYRQNSTDHRFHIFPMTKDEYPTLIVNIIDPITQTILTALFIQISQPADSTYIYCKERFQIPYDDEYFYLRDLREHTQSKKAQIKTRLMKDFSIDIEDAGLPQHSKSVLVSADRKNVLVLNFSKYSDWDAEEYKIAERAPDTEAVYAYAIDTCTKQPEPKLSMSYYFKSPFLQISIAPLTDSTHHGHPPTPRDLVKFTAQLLKQPKQADAIFALAQSAKLDQNSQIKLIEIFQQELTAQLSTHCKNALSNEKCDLVPSVIIQSPQKTSFFYHTEKDKRPENHIKNPEEQYRNDCL